MKRTRDESPGRDNKSVGHAGMIPSKARSVPQNQGARDSQLRWNIAVERSAHHSVVTFAARNLLSAGASNQIRAVPSVTQPARRGGVLLGGNSVSLLLPRPSCDSSLHQGSPDQTLQLVSSVLAQHQANQIREQALSQSRLQLFVQAPVAELSQALLMQLSGSQPTLNANQRFQPNLAPSGGQTQNLLANLLEYDFLFQLQEQQQRQQQQQQRQQQQDLARLVREQLQRQQLAKELLQARIPAFNSYPALQSTGTIISNEEQQPRQQKRQQKLNSLFLGLQHQHGGSPVLTSTSEPSSRTFSSSSNQKFASSGVIALATDSTELSRYQIKVRQQLELFVAQEEDVDSSTQGRKKNIRLGQVGLRCRHCSNLPLQSRARGSVYYPARLNGVYQAAQNMASSHLMAACDSIPEDILKELRVLRERRDTARGGKNYWAVGCQELGICEVEGGLRLAVIDTSGSTTPSTNGRRVSSSAPTDITTW